MIKKIVSGGKYIPPIVETLDFRVLQEEGGVQFNEGQRQRILLSGGVVGSNPIRYTSFFQQVID